MGGPPEVEAWAVKGGYRVKVYRETKDGEGYRTIQEYGREKGVHVGILWKETRVYEVVWEHEEAENGSTAREGEGVFMQNPHACGHCINTRVDFA